MKYVTRFWPLYFITIILFLICVCGADRTVTTIADSAPVPHNILFVIDAGHGGIDGGATGCNGTRESEINLAVALRLEQLCHLMGYRTLMIRRADISVYTEGNSISAQKASDLRQRAHIVNSTDGAILISIHQNTFSDSRYSGVQIFYAPTESSKALADHLRTVFRATREIKPADGIYLMQHIQKPGVLIECGFLSNPEEEAKLRTPAYQKYLCAAIVSGLSTYLTT